MKKVKKVDFPSLSYDEVKDICKEFSSIDKDIFNKVIYVYKKMMEKTTDFTYGEALQFCINHNVPLWAKYYINWTAKKSQIRILKCGASKRRVVLRLGRRLGKTECMCILILWYAFTQINRRSDTQYDVLIIAPYDTQVDLIFKRLLQLIHSSPLLEGELKRDIHHKIELNNGSIISGLTAGTKAGNGAANTRGQRADEEYNFCPLVSLVLQYYNIGILWYWRKIYEKISRQKMVIRANEKIS